MKTQFITDGRGNKVGIVIPIKKYREILEELEELEDIRSYDETKASNEQAVPVEEAFKKLDAKRKKK